MKGMELITCAMPLMAIVTLGPDALAQRTPAPRPAIPAPTPAPTVVPTPTPAPAPTEAAGPLVGPLAPLLTSFTLKSPIPSGTSSRAKVTLDRPAPASGAEVSFAGNSPAVAVPASQTVLPGERSKEFDIFLSPDVASASATITARRLGNQIQQTLEVVPALPYVLRCGPPLPKAEPPSDVMSTLGGHKILCRVRLDGKLPLKSHVYFASTRPDLVKPPESVVVGGHEDKESFPVPTAAVAQQTSVKMNAWANGGVSASLGRQGEVAVTIILNPPGLDRVSANPPEVYGGETTALAVVLTGPAPLPTPVQVSSSHPSVAPAPSEVTVPEDVHSTGAVLPTTVQTKDTEVTITARLGTVTKQAILLVKRTRLPDLIAAGNSYYESGSAVIRVSNYGEGDAAPSRLKAECYVGGNVYATKVFEVPMLRPARTHVVPWASPCVTAGGGYGAPPYKAYADFDHQVVESNETNNNTSTF